MPKPITQLSPILIALTLLSACAKAPDLQKGDTKALDKHYAKALNSHIKKKNIQGLSLILFDANKILYEKSVGYIDEARTKKASSDTLYQVGSVTKLFTATAMLRYVERQAIGLDSSIDEAGLRHQLAYTADNPITIRSLLSHQSGLGKDFLAKAFTPDPVSLTEAAALISPLQQAYLPYYVNVYSNAGYVMLGGVLEALSGQQYSDVIEREIITPLDLIDLGFSPDTLDQSRVSDSFFEQEKQQHYPLRQLSAGGLYASPKTIAAFAQSFLKDKHPLLSDAMRKEMTRQQNAPNAIQTQPIALGWMRLNGLKDVETPVLIHDGATLYQRTHLVLLPEYGLGAFAVSNSAEGGEGVHEFAFDIVEDAIKVFDRKAKPSYVQGVQKRKLTATAPVPGEYMTFIGPLTLKQQGDTLSTKYGKFTLVFTELDNQEYKVRLKLGPIKIAIPFLSRMRFVFAETQGKPGYYVKVFGKTTFLAASYLANPSTPANTALIGSYTYLPPKYPQEILIQKIEISEGNNRLYATIYADILQAIAQTDHIVLPLKQVDDQVYRIDGVTAPWSGKVRFYELDGQMTLEGMGLQFLR